MHVNKIPITSAAKTVVPNGHLIATSTDLTRRCNANPTEPKLGIFTYDYADDKSFNIQFKKWRFFFSFRIYFYITRWSTAASATTRKANASLASTGTRQKTATKWNAVRLLKHTRSQPRRWRNYRDSKHTNAVPTYKHYSCLILVLISRQNVPDWLITSRRTKRRTAIKTTT